MYSLASFSFHRWVRQIGKDATITGKYFITWAMFSFNPSETKTGTQPWFCYSMAECREIVDSIKEPKSICRDCENLQYEFEQNPGGKPIRKKGLIIAAIAGL